MRVARAAVAAIAVLSMSLLGGMGQHAEARTPGIGGGATTQMWVCDPYHNCWWQWYCRWEPSYVAPGWVYICE